MNGLTSGLVGLGVLGRAPDCVVVWCTTELNVGILSSRDEFNLRFLVSVAGVEDDELDCPLLPRLRLFVELRHLVPRRLCGRERVGEEMALVTFGAQRFVRQRLSREGAAGATL